MVEDMADNAKINADQQRAITQYLVAISASLREPAADSSASAPPAGY
jgi:hypothetical protein